MKVNVCCVRLVRRHHELAVLSVKIVALEDMVLVVKHANLVSIAPLLWTILEDVLTAVLESLSQMMGKQAVFLVCLGNTKTNLASRHARSAKQVCFVDQKILSVVNVQVDGYQKKPRQCRALNVFLELHSPTQVNRLATNAVPDYIVDLKMLPVASVLVDGYRQRPRRLPVQNVAKACTEI
jgi:hypothetical protein